MPFTVDDFEDLVRLLEQRPDWRDRLREVLLPREVLELPAAVAELVRISREALERLDRLEQGQARTDATLGVLQADVGTLQAGMGVLQTDVAALKDGQARMHADLGILKGSGAEQRFRELPRLFSHLIPLPRPLSRDDLDAWLQEHVAGGRLSEAEAIRILRSDIVFRGGESDDPACLVVEVSWSVDRSDVRRARERASLLRKVVPRTVAVVAGQRIADDAVELAEREGVARVIELELDEAATP